MKILSDKNPGCNPFLARWEEISFSRRKDAAIVLPDGSVARTFGEIRENAGRWADRFAGGGAVALGMGNGPDWPEVLIGAWLAGCAAIPVEPGTPIEKLDFLRPEHIVFAGKNGPEYARLKGGGIALPAETHLVKLTSGTTGDPRGIAFTGGQFLADVDKVLAAMGIGPSDLNYGVISFAHSYGLTNLVGALLGGGVPVVAARDPLPQAVAQGVLASGATVLPTVPAIVRALGGIAARRGRLRFAISAGAPLGVTDARRFHAAWGCKVHGFYGSSECGGICYDGSGDPGVPEGFVGPAMPGVSIEEADCGDGVTISIRGPSVGRAYLPAREGDVLAGGCFRPSDVLERVGAGYVVAGRLDHTIIAGGRKVRPETIERALLRSGGVEAAVVFSLPADAGRSQQIGALVVSGMETADLRVMCAGRLAPWEVPRRWFFAPELPVNSRGKTNRAEVARAALAGEFRESP